MRRQLTLAAALATGLLLAWQHLTAGAPAHHLLARADMPAISNWWGLLLLPLLAWVAASRIEARYGGAAEASGAIPGFVGGLLFGAAVALFFSLGRTDLCEAHALSVMADLEDAHQFRRLSNWARAKSLARVVVGADDGVLLSSPNDESKSHHDWWTKPPGLFPENNIVIEGPGVSA